MPRADKLRRRPLRVIGDTTDGRYLKTGPANHILVEITKQAALADLAAGPHTADLSFLFDHASDRRLLIQNDGAGAADLKVVGAVEVTGDLTLAGDIHIGAGQLRSAVSFGVTFTSGTKRYFSIVNGSGDCGLAVENDILCESLETIGGSIKSGTTLQVLGVSTLEGDTTLKETAAVSKKLLLGEATTSIHKSAAGTLDLNAVTKIKLISAAIEITGDLTLSETASVSKKLLLGDSQVSLNKSAANELTIVATTIKATTALEITGQLVVDDVRIDARIIETPSAAHDLSVRGGTTGQLILGRDGDFDIFATIKRRFGPAVALKATLGSASLPFAEAWIHGLLDASVVGVRGAFDADTYTTPPTIAELDAAFGSAASLGGGFAAAIRKTDGTPYIRMVLVTDQDKWAYSSAFTEL